MQPKPKRFYSDVAVVSVGQGFEIQLDGRALKTMAKQPLRLGLERRANMVAAEWRAVSDHIDANLMPATRLANIAIDRIPTDRAAITGDLMMYAETDLLCHRAAEEELRARQAAAWDPVLEFLETMAELRMVVTTGVVPVPQPQASLDTLRTLLEAADAETFAALAMLVPLLGSILLAVGLWKKGVSLQDAVAACRVDEDYQQERWGRDAEAESLWESKLRDMQACAVWL